jgi:MFS family permease
MGLMSASFGVGGALGLPLAAVIAEHFDWHAVFWFAAILGAVSGIFFAVLVPRIPSASADRLDPLGTLGLAAGLVTLLLGISKGGSWGWSSALTLGMFAASVVIFAVFAWWQLRTESPMVDLRTTVKRPVLMTNVASVAVGFSMFAMALISPQILELPEATGYGLGLSMLDAGLWLAPGGLAMMVSSPIASRIAAVRGPRFTLAIGCAIVAASYLAGMVLLGSAWQLSLLNVLISVGVGFAYSSLPSLINAAVPMSETAAANGINALARALGTSISSAVVGAVLTGLTISVAGQEFPSLMAFRIGLLIAAGMAILAGVLAVLIPVGDAEEDPSPIVPAVSRS